MSGVTLDSWTLESLISESVKDVAAGPFEIGTMVHHAFELARYIFHSAWGVVEAEQGSQFLASDRPLGIFASDGGFGDDPFEPSSIRVFPMSPRQALLTRGRRIDEAPEYGSVPEQLVRMANAAIAFRYDRELIGASKDVLERALSDTLVYQCNLLGISYRSVLRTA